MDASSETVIRNFCAAWKRKHIDELMDYFTDDAVYHNMPLEPLKGKPAIRDTINLFAGPAETIEFEMLHLASAGNIVLTERVDRFVIGGKSIALPVAGVFEVRGG